ncbi:MAG: hypothetical protein KC731_04740 [Myxococcales bacterium]|nr:hypothetical protein [Myxococcales bacterium]
MTLRKAAQRLAATYRRHGAGRTVGLAALLAARRAMVVERVHVLQLREPPTPPRIPGRLARFGEVEEIARLATDPIWDLDDLTADDVEHLFAAGHRCVLNIIDDQIAGYAWMNPHRVVIPRVRAAFSLLPNEVHIHKGFTHPRFRGHNLGIDRFAFWLRELPPRPDLTLLTDFAFDNFSTFVRVGRLGLEPLGTITYLAARGWEHRMLSPSLASRRLEVVPPDLPHRVH